jgi:Cu-Zn family superoxide dismutase
MKKIFIYSIIGLLISCTSNKTHESPEEIMAKCQINSANGSSVYGEVKFVQINNKVSINVEVKGLSYGLHAIHIHEFGDCSSFDAKSAGGHWNPNNNNHGEWGSESHHMGDIANLFADSSGNSSLKFETDLWCLNCKEESNNIIGKSIIIHQGLDDFHSQPSGNAGKRIGCGIISSVL